MKILARLSTVGGFAIAVVVALVLDIALIAIGYAQSQLFGDYAMLFGNVLVLACAWLIGRFHTRRTVLVALFSGVGLATIFLGLVAYFGTYYRLDVLREPDDGMWGLRAQAVYFETFLSQTACGILSMVAAFLRKQ